MNLFERVFALTHYRNPNAWVETTAAFTGKKETAIVRTKMGPRKADYPAYEIVYLTEDGRKQHGWYSFHPLPDPEEEQLKGMRITIRYKKRKPYIFEWSYAMNECKRI